MISTHDSIALNAIKAGLAGSGGYEVAHESPGLELGVYTLVAYRARLEPGAGLS